MATTLCHPAPSGAVRAPSGAIAIRRRPGRLNAKQTISATTSTRMNRQDPPLDRAVAGLARAGAAAALAIALATVSGPALAVSGGSLGIGESGLPISNRDYSGQDLRGKDFTKTIMKATNFSKADLRLCSLFGSYAAEANFEGADLRGADMEQADFERANFRNARLAEASVTAAQFKNAIVDGSDWTDVDLRKDIRAALCKNASGVNPVTGVATRESLLCE